MTAPPMTSPFPWCARLARMTPDALGAVLRDLVPTSGPVVAILHRREVLTRDGGEHHFLHVAVVTFDGAPVPPSVEASIERAVQTWVGVSAALHPVAHTDTAALRGYHRVPEGVVAPVLAGVAPRPVPPRVERPAPPAAAAPAPKPTAPAQSEQRGLFG